MKKRILGITALFFSAAILTGCQTVGEKTTNFSMIYGTSTILSFLFLMVCCFLVKKKKSWFILLFSSVSVVNIGYTLLSVSTSLQMALMANRIAYLGSVFLPLSMLMIILNVTNTKWKKWLPISLFSLAVVMFFIAASPGILDIYYKDVSFAVVHGVSTLIKVYGPLHPLYLFYLLGYFAAMIAVIIGAFVKKTVDTTVHAVILAIAVFGNIFVWFIEQLSDIDFEFLSVSYIISELFLLGLHMVMKENQRLRELIRQKEEALQLASSADAPQKPGNVSADAMEYFTAGLDTLTPTEALIYHAYLMGTSTKEIMAQLNIKENTLKFHNKNLYGKLGVSSRKQLLETHRAIEANKKRVAK